MKWILLLRRLFESVFKALRLKRTLIYSTLYLQDWSKYEILQKQPLNPVDAYPCLFDKSSTTPFDSHYFYQSLWAFSKIQTSKSNVHVDIGSLLSYVGFVAKITEVIFVDIRPPKIGPDIFKTVSGSVLGLPFADNVVRSLSCLHVAEHIGLGRYGDPLDPYGTQKACRELVRILAPNGNLYFSLPVGMPRICFNAHRIHSPSQIIAYFSDLELVSFSIVDDNANFLEAVNPNDFAESDYACGLFHFVKKGNL